MSRAYLDWNATAPLRAEARAAMWDALEAVGNPSSVHAEGRRARGLVERAREAVAAALGAGDADVVFTSGATEAAALALAGRGLACAPVEHEAVLAWADPSLGVTARGAVIVPDPARATLQIANSETGVLQAVPQGLAVMDLSQGFGKLPLSFTGLGCDMAFVSAHKIGGPKGVGALVLRRGTDLAARIRGGGQEAGRRAGTENVPGIAGFGAAATAAARDVAAGVWDGVAELGIILEQAVDAAARDTILVGNDAARLPNTFCLVTPGWTGERQVIEMDLAGFAVSAGSACSSGKVRRSAVLAAMGFDDIAAASAIRVSLGPETTAAEVTAFADTWCAAERRFRQRAA